MCQKYVPMCLQLVKRQIHRLIFFFPPSTSHIAYFLKPSVKCIIDCYVFKNSTFYNHSSRYLGVDVALSVMPMQDWDTESTGISADSLGRHLVLLYPVCGTGQQVGKAGWGDMAERTALHQRCSLRLPASWQGGGTNLVFSGLLTYKQFPRSPGGWQGR